MNTHEAYGGCPRAVLGVALSLTLMTHVSLVAAAFTPGGQDDPNLEIDANIANVGVTDEEAYTGDDWETIYKKVNNIATTETINPNNVAYSWVTDPAPISIYTGGGSKDINDISSWKHKDGSVPDKDDIRHAMAAAYGVDDGAGGKDLILYLAADRYANDGDAQMGAWFFQEEVLANPDGSFSGNHQNGDVLWIGEFTRGGQVATLKVLVWNDPGLPNYRSDLTQLKNSNLALLIEGPGGEHYSAAVNDQPMSPTVWPYTPKQGEAGTFPVSSFMEGGINISALLGGDVPCFSSFLMETRSSSEINAQLKDFVLGSLNTCRIEVSKSCPTSTLDPSSSGIDHYYEIYVRNSGFGTLDSVSLIDNNATPGDTSDDMTHTYFGTISSGEEVKVWEFITNSTQNPPTNTVYATGHVGSVSTAQVSAQATCPAVPLNPKIDVSKACTTKVAAEGGKVVVKVGFSGQVCNTDEYDPVLCPECTNTKLKNVSVSDSEVGGLTITTGSGSGTSVTLSPGECGSFNSSYYPSAVVGSGGLPSDQEYSDTVTANGEEQIAGTPVSGTATATCKLCEPDEVCPTTP